MVKQLFDTNILINSLKGTHQARNELALYPDKSISIVMRMEIQLENVPAEQSAVDQFLLRFTVLPLETQGSKKAVALRKSSRVKLPDAIIWATAQCHKWLLITRNSKDFSPSAPDVRVPYVL